MTKELEKALAKLRQAQHAVAAQQGHTEAESAETVQGSHPQAPAADAAFRVVIEERLRSLEQQIAEVKTRVNGLLFLLAGTVATEAVRRIVS